MKYVDEFRDHDAAQRLAERIAAEADPARAYGFMEFCGGHTHAIARYGVASLLPANVRMIHGPGCPVCVLPIGRVDQAIALALEHSAILCSYGDTLRVPASGGLSLLKAKARGGDIRMVYSAADALKVARQNPAREVVFFAIGFETTTPPTALVIRQAAAEGLANFSVLCCHVLTPAAIRHVLDSPEVADWGTLPLDGFIGPAHVSIVIGSAPYEPFAAAYRKPVVIAGFEPLDVMQAVLMLLRQVNEGRAEVENEFLRAVGRGGNPAAIAAMAEVFEHRESFEWRGLGTVPDSALRIRPAYAAFDAERRFDLHYRPVPDHKQCECGAILRGLKTPTDCKLFGSVCTPDNAMGSCMVSSEGACAAHYAYGRFRITPEAPAALPLKGATPAAGQSPSAASA
ncbi:hydrogenase formation protein HypD [Rubrivivax gelatinosus]|uniref:Hydrogenase maturation factor n=1 Tax=Rubrivivax gelatinosus TaxID=28068 RepID=A0ABS1DW79_RUBGE|nr:hydrogenase formation protein HypD [Rubrivivax gelatinosus]MBK1713733.1 hydrogenase formation protein HypD [Rubrivivax gelatinosus]